MRYIAIILSAISIVATALPFINSNQWWIGIFDFPRVQIACLCLLSIIAFYTYVKTKSIYKVPLLLLLATALVVHLQMIIVYTPLFPTEAKDSNSMADDKSFSLLVSNVRMDNDDKEKFISLVRDFNPDILLINEPNEEWKNSLKVLDRDFPYSIKKPLNNTYGMMLLSKFPLSKSAVNFLVEDDIPSIYTEISLPSGDKFDFYGVHSEPPKPGSDTYERDTELLIIGKKVRDSSTPAIVAGDLNDVGWSRTSKLFRSYSQLVDPRRGRGLYNTYSVFVPLFRYPLDHIFYSEDFGLKSLKKLRSIGSDHFPILISLNYEPGQDKSRDLEKKSSDEKDDIRNEIEKGSEIPKE